MGDVAKELAAMRDELAQLRAVVETLTTPPEMVSYERAAQILDVKIPTIRRLVREGELLAVVIRKRPKIPMSEIRRIATPKPAYREERRSGRGRGAMPPSENRLDAYLKTLRPPKRKR